MWSMRMEQYALAASMRLENWCLPANKLEPPKYKLQVLVPRWSGCCLE